MRLLCIAALTLCAGLVVAVADDKKDPPAGDRAARVAELKKKFQADFDELTKKFEKAGTPAEKNAVRTEAKETAVLTAGKAIKIAEENPKDAAALDAATFVIGELAQFGVTGTEFDKAVGIIADNHLGSPKVKDLVMVMPQFGPAGEKFLKAAAEKATDKDVKGMALFFLGSMTGEQADEADSEKAAAELTAKAIDYFQRAAKEAPDTRVGPDTIAKAAETEIAGLKSTAVGQPAPGIAGKDLDGKAVKIADYKGKVVLFDIWATWCGPCRAMIPHEREMVKKLQGRPFVLVSVSADDQKETLTKFLEKEPMPWTHWHDGKGGDVVKAFRVKAFPTLYLIDANGVTRRKWIGAPPSDQLDKAVEELVKEAEKAKG